MHCTALVVDADVYPRKPSNCAAAAPLQQQQGAAGSHALSVFQFCSRAWGVGMLPGWACMHACGHLRGTLLQDGSLNVPQHGPHKVATVPA